MQKRSLNKKEIFHIITLCFCLLLLPGYFTACVSPSQRTTRTTPSEKIPPTAVWNYIKQEAPRYKLDPRFVYAIAWAESSLNAKAATHKARGIMQMSKVAWVTVTDESYNKAWNWKTNATMGMRYLAHCKKLLNNDKKFSYPLLAASYRYGPGAVKQSGHNIKKLPQPHNNIYKELFKGNKAPVKVPG